MRKRIALLMAVLTALGVSTTNVYAGEGKQELTITCRNTEALAPAFTTWIETTYNNWEKKDQVEVKMNAIEGQDSDYLTKVKLGYQDASQCGDLVWEDSFILPADAAAGYLADITSNLEGYADWSNGGYIEAVKEGALGGDGHYYGIQASTDSRGLLVNKDVLEAAGLGADWQPKDWAELLDGCRAIKEKCEDVIPMWMSVGKASGEGTSMNGYEMLLYGTPDADQSLYDTESGKWVVSSESILAANQFLVTLFEEGLTGEYSEMLDANEGNYAWEYLKNGQLGIYLTGSWFPQMYQEGGVMEWPEFTDKLNFIPMPTKDGSGTLTMSGGWAWTIPALSDNIDLAFEFLTEMMKPENYSAYIAITRELPVRDLSEYEEITSAPFFTLSQEKLEVALFRPKNDQYSTVSTYIAEMSENAVVELDAQAAMDTFATNVESAIGADAILKK